MFSNALDCTLHFRVARWQVSAYSVFAWPLCWQRPSHMFKVCFENCLMQPMFYVSCMNSKQSHLWKKKLCRWFLGPKAECGECCSPPCFCAVKPFGNCASESPFGLSVFRNPWDDQVLAHHFASWTQEWTRLALEASRSWSRCWIIPRCLRKGISKCCLLLLIATLVAKDYY